MKENARKLLMILAEPFLRYTQLTIRERQAATLAARGHDYKEIRAALNVSQKTVYRDLHNAAAKISRQDGSETTAKDFTKHMIRQLREELT